MHISRWQHLWHRLRKGQINACRALTMGACTSELDMVADIMLLALAVMEV